MNETLLRSIVTQPWRENYVYARNFSSLALVKNVVLSKTCRVIGTSAAPTLPSTSLATVTAPTVIPSFNGRHQLYNGILNFNIQENVNSRYVVSGIAAFRKSQNCLCEELWGVKPVNRP